MADTRKKVDLSKNPFLDEIDIRNFEPDPELLETHIPFKETSGESDARK